MGSATARKIVIDRAKLLVSVPEALASLEGAWRLTALEGKALPSDAALTVRLFRNEHEPQTFDCLLDLTSYPSPPQGPNYQRVPRQTMRTHADIRYAALRDELHLNFGKGWGVVFERGSNIGSNAVAIDVLTERKLVVGAMSFTRIESDVRAPHIIFCEHRLDQNVTHVTCDDGSAPNLDLSALADVQSLQALDINLNGGAVTGAATLARFPALRRLSIVDSKFDDISGLKRAKQLEELVLDGTDVSDLSAIAGLKRLRVLSLSATKVADLSPLANLTGLRELDLGNLPATDVSVLSGLSGLESLRLINTKIRSAAPLFKLPNLKHLSAVSAHLTGVIPKSEITRLEVLEREIDSRTRPP